MSHPISYSINSNTKQSSFSKLTQKILLSLKQINKIIPLYSKIDNMRKEISLLTSYSSDTVYRLHYNSMTYEYVSPAIIRLIGFTPSEMKKVNFRSLILETRMVNNGMKNITSFEELEKSRKQGNVSKWQADY